MILGAYRGGREQLPRVLHISIARYNIDLQKDEESLRFLVSIHEEGTGITWQNVTVDPDDYRYFIETTHELYLWSLNVALSPAEAHDRIRNLGTRLYDSFIGGEGKKILSALTPTAILLDVDETILNLPWELIGMDGESIVQETPFGWLLTTCIIPRHGRDPETEDNVVRILVVANSTLDLAGAEREIDALKKLEGCRNGYSIELKVLPREEATKNAFASMLSTGNYDILHFSGHGKFDATAPETSTIFLADGLLTAEEILKLKWGSPPYLVFNSACESGRAAGGKRLVSDKDHSNGLAAAFIAAGFSAYAGYFWPVTDTGAALFTREFYETLFNRENVGIAFLEARKYVVRELGESGDLTGYSAVLYGDSASKHRRNLAMAK